MSVNLLVTKLTDSAKLPEKAYPDDAGIDLFSDRELTIEPFGNAIVTTGIALAIPRGYCLVIKDRSGFVTKKRCSVVAGVIDEQYRGEVKVAFENHSGEFVSILAGDKIAQALLIEVPKVDIHEVPELTETDRGSGGFGSTDRV